jgi:hypothetical protein
MSIVASSVQSLRAEISQHFEITDHRLVRFRSDGVLGGE